MTTIKGAVPTGADRALCGEHGEGLIYGAGGTNFLTCSRGCVLLASDLQVDAGLALTLVGRAVYVVEES